MKLRLQLALLGFLIGVVSVLVYEMRSQGHDTETTQIQYRPGAYFPEGFPLHGDVRLLSSPVVEAGKRERVRVEYIVGDRSIGAGETLEVWKHFTSDVEEFQNSDPGAPAYFSVETGNPDVIASTRTYTNWVQRNTPSVFPYRKTAAVDVREGTLKKGDRIVFDLGGEQGVRMQHYEENLFNFRFVILRDNQIVGYGGDALMRVTGGTVQKLRVRAPSIVELGERFTVEVVPQDAWGSLAKDHEGHDLVFKEQNIQADSLKYDPQLEHFTATDVRAVSEGTLRIEVETSDGSLRGISNPIWVKRHRSRGVYFGELHQHSYLHDGRGVFEELYLYGRRTGLLDFGAITSHHAFITGGDGPRYYLEEVTWPKDHWPEIEKAARRLNGWQDLVTVLGYEYSVGTRAGGHHNVYYNAEQAPTTMHLDPVNLHAPIAKMLKTLQLVRKPTLVIPHIGGGPPSWSHPTDPRIERLFEIASVHGVFEESYFKHLASGHRLGVIGAGDTHTSAMGNAYPGLIYTMTNALAGVYASGKTRNEIWGGLYGKSTFAVTGNKRVLLDFSINGVPMGGGLASGLASPARIEARVSGTSPLLSVQLLKNLAVIYSAEPARRKGDLVRVTWGDNIYQRRAALGMTKGELRPEQGTIRLVGIVHRDQAFEEIRQDGTGVAWTTAAVSGDRDGFIADLSEVGDGALRFQLDDATHLGFIEVEVPLAQLRQEGRYSWKKEGSALVEHSYMKMLGLEPTFFIELDMIDSDGPLDFQMTYIDPEPPQSGDFYLLRVEQLDTNKAWSSPVWIN